MCLKILTFASILLFAQAIQASPTKSSTTAAPLSLDEQRLINARRENEEAQARYYTALTNKLASPTPTPTPPSFRRSMAENPTSVIGVIGAIVAASFAALVGLLTLYVNNRAGLRFHYDTQFFEAIKLFGDKNKDVRSSAAGALGLIANRRVPKMDVHPLSILKTEQPYFGVAHNQLFIALLSEQDRFTLYQIRRGIYQIIERNPGRLATALINTSARSQTGLRLALARFFVANGAKDEKDLDHLWREVPQRLFGREVFEEIVKNESREFAHAFVDSSLDYALVSDDERKKKKHLALVHHDLDRAIYGLYLIVGIYSATLKQSSDLGRWERIDRLFMPNADLQSVDLTAAKLKDVFFKGANLENAKLGAANLQQADLKDAVLLNADLRGACLDNADLANARMAGAAIDAATSLANVKWWKANYFT